MLRKARSGDEPQILKIIKIVLGGYGLKTNPKETDIDITDIQKYYFNNSGYFAVIDNNGIIGSYGIFKISNFTCELRKMYLLPEYHGKGFGKLMMEDVFIKAKELGYTEMILETNRKLNKAIVLYQKYGFEEYCCDHFSDRCDFAMRIEL